MECYLGHYQTRLRSLSKLGTPTLNLSEQLPWNACGSYKVITFIGFCDSLIIVYEVVFSLCNTVISSVSLVLAHKYLTCFPFGFLQPSAHCIAEMA